MSGDTGLTLQELEQIKSVLVDPLVEQINITLKLIADPIRGYMPRPEVELHRIASDLEHADLRRTTDTQHKEISLLRNQLWGVLIALFVLIVLAVRNVVMHA